MSDTFFCVRCRAECPFPDFRITGEEWTQYGAIKFIILCNPCYNSELTTLEKQMYFKRVPEDEKKMMFF